MTSLVEENKIKMSGAAHTPCLVVVPMKEKKIKAREEPHETS
jgi:hypothetical protein